ncbi:hypothetical protein [Paracoccus albus]|uniref:hypothetical protein n=1 Tax=Paracoccus albus TaxID=3017784 RepID=UPI0022F018D4|nr:hypothetical protein [Paracoccus albus]WBU62390.1 hypothetical protein PAF20_18785 [Paracoccus albus]
MAKKMIVHAGWHKTGSTSIQKWCVQNYHVLRENGILYPMDEHLLWDGHHRLAREFSNRHTGCDTKINVPAIIEDYKKEAGNTLFLSSEEFEFIPERGIRSLVGMAGQVEVKVLIFLRNIIDYLLADYQQNVRMETTKYRHDIYRFSFQYNAYAKMNYLPLLQKWAAVLGADAVDLIRYEKASGSVISQLKKYLQLCDVDTKDDDKRANPSLQAVSLRVLQEINRTGDVPEREEIIRRLYELEASDDQSYSVLDSELAEAFLKRIAAPTRRAAEIFGIEADYLLANPVVHKLHVDGSSWRERFEAVRQEFRF